MYDRRAASSPGPAITVAIPTYNRATVLGHAIESALAQTFRDLELIVLDDASSDATPTVVASHADERLRYVRNDANLGMTANWNRAFALARAPWVSLLHDDVVWRPQFLERGMALIGRHENLGLVYSIPEPEIGFEKHDRVFTPSEALDRLRRRNEVPVSAVLVRRAAFDEVGGFRDRWPFSQDWQLWLEIAARYPTGYLGEVFGFWCADSGVQVTDRWFATPLIIAQDRLGMLRETIPALPIPEAERAGLFDAAVRSLAEAQLVTSWHWVGEGDRARARLERRFAFEIDPALWRHALPLAAASLIGLSLPAFAVRALNRVKAIGRPIFRRA